MGNEVLERTGHNVFEQEDMRLLDAELDGIAQLPTDDIFEQDDLKALDTELDTIAEEYVQPGWKLAEFFKDENERAKQETRRLLGAIAIRGEAVASTEVTNTEQTLMTAIKRASCGDASAENVIRNNVATDVAERLFKAAHQTRISMQFKDGKLQQEGRLLTNIHKNTLEHSLLNKEMLRRSQYELHNAHVFEQLHASGVLKTHDAIVFSPSSTAMSLADKKKYNFFIDTETCSIQRLSADGNDVTFESAFVAGKRTPQSQRHDIAAIQKMAAEGGIELTDADGTEIIQHVFLVPKNEFRHVGQVVKWYDQAVGGTFYGQDAPVQDYDAYAKVCEERTKGFDETVEKIVQQLQNEADALKTPIEAIMRLDELSERYCVKEAVADGSLDAAVFGPVAAQHIMDARQRIMLGDLIGADQSLRKAQATADSSSCPLAKERATGESDADSNTSNEENSEEQWMNCPFCSAKVFGDPCAVELSCWDCTAKLFHGKVISKGNGGTKQRRAERDEHMQTLLHT
jgi:hypothetical protein